MNRDTPIPSVSVSYARDGSSTRANEFGMRPMQERAYQKRGEQYLLIKSPPASGKSRALMFIALDKLENQGLKQALVVVPERAIGSSFNDEPLSDFGFFTDWKVEPRWNLCNAAGSDNGSKVDAVKAFLDAGRADVLVGTANGKAKDKAASDEPLTSHSQANGDVGAPGANGDVGVPRILVCTHATFRFAMEKFGPEVFDDRLIAVDEFHHISANPDNRLGEHVRQLMARDKAHLVAMTGSYFRGDAEAVLHPDDESRFDTVTYTYYEQLNGYEYLKQLDIGYYFYSGSYIDDITKVLDPDLKTILHIPHVASRESTKRGKDTEVSEILGVLGDWQGKDEATGFDLVKRPDGRILKVADLVDDGPDRHAKVLAALKDPAQKNNRDHVDIIIALGMAKEGFDWIWCEHALTVGYRSSLTEIIQIIGRATRDAKDKTRARFTNLIAEPDASEQAVTEAVNDTLKAIAASLLMEQVLAPRFEFRPKNPNNGPTPGYDYGPGGYDPEKTNVGYNPATGHVQLEIKGLAEPKSREADRICREDLNELVTAFVQDKPSLEKGLFAAEELVPEELTQVRMGKIIQEKFPNLDDEDHEAVRQHAIAALNIVQQAKKTLTDEAPSEEANPGTEPAPNTALIDGIRQFALDMRELDIDLIDRINPFGEAYAILSKAMTAERLEHLKAIIAAKRATLSLDEARELAKRALLFKKEKGRLPSITAHDPWEKRMAEGIAFLQRKVREEKDG